MAVNKKEDRKECLRQKKKKTRTLQFCIVFINDKKKPYFNSQIRHEEASSNLDSLSVILHNMRRLRAVVFTKYINSNHRHVELYDAIIMASSRRALTGGDGPVTHQWSILHISFFTQFSKGATELELRPAVFPT